MERCIEGRLVVVGTELGHVERFIIVRGKNIFALFDGFAQRIGDIVCHRFVHDHRPAAEIKGWNGRSESFKVLARQSCGTVAQLDKSFQNLAIHRQVTKAIVQCCLPPALDTFVEDRIDCAALNADPPARIGRAFEFRELRCVATAG